MPRAQEKDKRTLLTREEWRARRELRREKQRKDNVNRAAKMHAARLKSEADNPERPPQLKQSICVGCSGWRYWKWRDSFYEGVPQNDWFDYYLKRFDTVEINASFYSWPTIAGVQSWRRQPGNKKFIYTVKVCELITHYQEVQGHEGSREGFRDDRRYPGRPDGLLPVSAAAELSLHEDPAGRHRQSARSRAPQRRGIQARELVE